MLHRTVEGNKRGKRLQQRRQHQKPENHWLQENEVAEGNDMKRRDGVAVSLLPSIHKAVNMNKNAFLKGHDYMECKTMIKRLKFHPRREGIHQGRGQSSGTRSHLGINRLCMKL